MSNVSPSRTRLRTKTSELTDFFRGTGHNSAQPTEPSKGDSSTMAMQNLDVPLSGDESATGTKKKITRIPLFGRSRKKSNHSASSSPFASSCIGRESSEGGEQSSASRGLSTDRRPSEPSLIGIPPPPLPVPTKVPPSSLSSKFAARFSHSRSTKAAASHTESAPVAPAVQPSGLHPPNDTRSASFESGSSAATKSRSTTPRPAKPTITVSLSPDSVDEFKDLFTQPTPGNSRSELSKTTRSSKSRPDSDIPRSSSAPNQSPEPSIYRRGHTPASAIAAAVRHRHTASIGNERPPSTSSKNSRNNSDSDKGHERNSGGSTPRLSDARESPRLGASDPEKGLPPSLGRRGSVATESIQPTESSSSSSLRSRMKQPTSPSRSKPPTMPLPLPPTPPMPLTSPPTSPRGQHFNKESVSSSSSSSQPPGIRPRAHTISGVNPPISGRAPLSPTSSVKLATGFSASVSAPVAGETLDADTASVEQLQQALKARNQQYDELASFVLKMTEAHVAEVTALEKKICTLEKDAVKLEKQVQGFMWMINEKDTSHHPKPLPPGILNQSRFAPSTNSNDSDQETHRIALPGPPRSRVVYNSDSGAESHASGAESLRASGASGSESLSSMIRNKKLRRPYPLGDSAYVASRTGSVLRSSKIPAGLVEKGLPEIPYSTASAKRTSMSSISASPSSSTSSLLPPSPSITMSSLSAIPEGPTSMLRLPRLEGTEPHDDRRVMRASNRISTSSLTSSSTAASSSYSANIKRSRPPSIAQVLEKSPNMDGVLEKLHPFS